MKRKSRELSLQGELESFVLNEEEPKRVFNMNAELMQEQKTTVNALVWVMLTTLHGNQAIC